MKALNNEDSLGKLVLFFILGLVSFVIQFRLRVINSKEDIRFILKYPDFMTYRYQPHKKTTDKKT